MKAIYCFFLIFLGLGSTQAQQLSPSYYNEKAGKYNVGDDCVGVQGYDLISYYTENKAIKGSPEHQYTYDDIHYFFSTEANKKKFASEPEKYLPAYGGFCAFGIGMPNGFGGSIPGKYPVDPETFKIIDEQLYLFYHQEGYDALKLWNKAEDRIRKMADLRWQQMASKQGK